MLERYRLLKVYERLPSLIRVAITFIIVVTGWVLFRNEDIHYAFGVIQRMYVVEWKGNMGYLQNDFIFSLMLCVIFSFSALMPFLKTIQDKVYHFQLTRQGKIQWIFVSVLLYYTALSYIAALGI
ncbi:MAG: hypothetical protein KatS3mg028_0623 [Bacteroidia bacterium]|nr:MAG: hypothetical protein KatS3mg028_0623 [Bacteroidia bacterium]